MSENSLVKDARRFPIGWRIWFWLLIIVNFVGPLFFLQHIEPRLVLLTYIVAGITIVILHKRLGWVRLLGIGHILWIGLLPWLIFHYIAAQPVGMFGIWLISVICIDVLCFGIDIVDIIRYLFGNRTPIV